MSIKDDKEEVLMKNKKCLCDVCKKYNKNVLNFCSCGKSAC